MNMKKANVASTPAVPEPSEEAHFRVSSPAMTDDEASRFPGLVARVNYLSLDRSDLQFAAKTSSQHMAQPKVCNWPKIKRIARYLINVSRAVQKFAWQQPRLTSPPLPMQIKTNVDLDWAGNKITRKFTSGGAMYLGGHLTSHGAQPNRSWRCRAARPSSTASSKEQPEPKTRFHDGGL